MCLTAKPTCEWTGSIAHLPVAICCAVAVLIWIFLLCLGVRFGCGPWSVLLCPECSTQSDRGPLRRRNAVPLKGDARASGDPDPGARARRRRPQPRAHPVRRQAAVRRKGRELRLDGRDRRGRRRRQGHPLPPVRIACRARHRGARRGRGAPAGRLHPRRAAARPRRSPARAPDRLRRGAPGLDRRVRGAAGRRRSRGRPPRLRPLRGQPPARHAAAARDRPGLRPRAARRHPARRPLGGPLRLPARRARVRRSSASRTAGGGRSTGSSRPRRPARPSPR